MKSILPKGKPELLQREGDMKAMSFKKMSTFLPTISGQRWSVGKCMVT